MSDISQHVPLQKWRGGIRVRRKHGTQAGTIRRAFKSGGWYQIVWDDGSKTGVFGIRSAPPCGVELVSHADYRVG